MFKISFEADEMILTGRFDALQAEPAKAAFQQLRSTTVVNCRELAYISSAGLGVLLMTEKRLRESGHRLVLRHLNPHLREIFTYAGFDAIFKIE
jgi:anti-anti-sigma factor